MAGVEVDRQAPTFQRLRGTDGEVYSLSSFADARILVVVFVANGCPTVRALEPWFVDFQRAYRARAVRLVWINSNNASLSPPDTFEEMVRRTAASGLAFPYLEDGDGQVGRAFGALTTPHAFVLDEQRQVRYHGRVADSRQASTVTLPYVQLAVEDLLAGREVAVPETEPYGCAIVW
jgi:thiol-disulfide isomerase/thioredoxin